MYSMLRNLLILLVILPHSAFSAEVNVKTVLKSATVYSDRAALIREATATLPIGKHVIVFDNLNARLYPDSLRIEAKGTANGVLGALIHKEVNSVSLVSPREKDLHKQKRELEKKLKLVNVKKTAVFAKRDFLKSLQAHASESINEEKIGKFDLNTTQWMSAANTIAEGMLEVLQAELNLTIEIEQIGQEITKINEDLAQLSTGQKKSYEVRLPVEVVSAGHLTFSLSYQLPGATWHPVYDARLEKNTKRVGITQYGAVSQRTGEDWDNIELTLSTARPHRGATSPTLGTQWVEFMPELPRRSSAASFDEPVSTMLSERSSVAAEVAALPQATSRLKAISQQSADISSVGFTSEFAIPGVTSVPADGTQSKVLITTLETDSKISVHVKPQRDTKAYIVANIGISGDAPLLPGTVNLFREGAYLGKTHIPLLSPNKRHDLSFGIDDNIDVSYSTVKDETGESGILLGVNKTAKRHTITEIRNLRDQAVDLVVMQTIPVSTDEKIKVDLSHKKTTPGFQEDNDNIKGLLTWSFELKPQESRDIKLGYSVAWPKGKNIVGFF